MCTCSSHLLQMAPWNYHKLRWNIHPLSSTSLLSAINPWFSSHGTRCMDQKLNLILFFWAKILHFQDYLLSQNPGGAQFSASDRFQKLKENQTFNSKNQILGLLSTFFVLLFFCCITDCMWQLTNEAARNHLATGKAMWRPLGGMF